MYTSEKENEEEGRQANHKGKQKDRKESERVWLWYEGKEIQTVTDGGGMRGEGNGA